MFTENIKKTPDIIILTVNLIVGGSFHNNTNKVHNKIQNCSHKLVIELTGADKGLLCQVEPGHLHFHLVVHGKHLWSAQSNQPGTL